MPYCPTCGAEITTEQRFCPSCGRALAANTREGDRQRTRRPDDPDRGGLLGWSIGYPGRAGIGTVVIGGVLGLLMILVVPLLILIGYMVRLTGAAGRGEPAPPEFDDLGGMLRDGVVWLVIVVAMVLALGLLSAFVLAVADAATTSVLALPLVPLWVVAIYLFPASYANFAVHRRWRSAFDLAAIGDLATSGTYLIGWFHWVVVINFLGYLVVAMLVLVSFLTIVGWIILVPMLYFYWYGIDAALWGRVYHACRG